MVDNLKPKTKNSSKPVRQAQGKPAGSMAELTRSTSSGSRKPASSMGELMAKQGSFFQVLQKGQAVSGIIKKLTPQEILMDIGAKGDALVIEFDKQNLENLLANLKVGDRVTATVISPESEEGFPVVSLRRMLDDIIFNKFEDLARRDEAFEVEVAEPTRGGYFTLTGEGVRGFLPASQILSQESIGPGAKIKVKILEYDRSKKRAVFSEKATFFLTNIDSIKALLKPGEIIEAEITEVAPYGLFVKIEPPARSPTRRASGLREQASGPGGKGEAVVEGFVHISEISYARVENLGASYKVGGKIKAEVLEIDTANRRVNLSIKKTLEDVFANVRNKYKVEEKVRGTVTEVKTRGITLAIEDASGPEGLRPGGGVNGFIPSDKIPSGTTYDVGQDVEAVVVDFDGRRRVIILSPILKAIPIGYR
ncbi:MAG: hypothetical protein A3C30_02790 [Candidatus Levybacteria bacterium RIFCSPHIGHO2_02_FULL_40_18]|nr:MAG: hypothetical protein A2869_05190 [Candidatus Levybacteria bacterium RIFCSPHIGHO2_01_FULL_40_58]OGH26903.1 MAG: hypothetical protein A3C30_02790 [Candidatus Levybacteria bacterium RIFCSPHIGHO2_02_FULL_40_18]OGH32025.1 MAG: hypothetical protein A3E43_03770 [Candidatus Levybacteria bacterium RIFCSPHIGHO2_12_FULL_40_31]OGH40853.1 MAG: hypothetical protein A2894_04630 [Candidatus Levybacteria bacterium RIFCSPLOWO2_01_FULL_40_64]OGH49520.1 MAG: hypothetical protein A3I54_02350 [Candidatus Lev